MTAATQTTTAQQPPSPSRSTSNNKPPCVVCHEPGRFRCKRCRMAIYCGATCQAADYSSRHRTACLAHQELAALLHGTSLPQATRDYHVACDAVKTVVTRQPEQQQQQQQLVPVQETSSNNPDPVSASNAPQHTTQVNDPSTPALESDPEPFFIHSRKPILDPSPQQQQPSWFWNVCMEDFPSLQCLQIVLRPNNDSNNHTLQLQQLHLHTQSVSTERTLLHIRYRDQWDRLELPCDCSCTTTTADPQETVRVYLVNDQTAFSIRVKYRHNYATPPPSSFTLTRSTANALACRYCHSRLFVGTDTVISSILPMPSGRWDGMEDYLICYEGQTSIQFSSSSTMGQSGTVLVSETVLVVHPDDMKDRVTVVAVPGYGESPLDNDDDDAADHDATVRGSRPWRDLVGGASLACSVCHSLLGYASGPHSHRLFQHQLLAVAEGQPVQTYSAFVAHEMIRYAETKAVFTLFCYCGNRVLLLRLLSWEAMTAQSLDGSAVEQGILRIQCWRQTAKLVFEETMDHTTDDSAVWTWTSGDWCCPAPQRASAATMETNSDVDRKRSSSHVRLYLPETEYKQLRHELYQACECAAKEAVQATILAKLGPSAASRSGIRLAMVPL